MHLLAEFGLPTRPFVLGGTLTSHPELSVELDGQYALDPRRPFTYLWVEGVAGRRFERAVEGDDSVAFVEHVGDDGRRARYLLQRSDGEGPSLYDAYVRVHAELLDAVGSEDRWTVRMRFPGRPSFDEFRSILASEDVEIELRQLDERESFQPSGSVLTADQSEVLALAHERGFFDVPRRTSMAELAEEIGISDQAVSERLRRGYAALVGEHVV